MPIREPFDLDEREDYLLALGNFISMFAQTEALLFSTLRHFAEMKKQTASAVFSGVRVDAAMSFITRLTEVDDPGQTIRDELNYIFPQLRQINSFRNDLIHFGSLVKGGERKTSNRSRVHTDTRIRETPASPEIIQTASHDLNKINLHLVYRVLSPGAPTDFNSEAILGSSWRYKSHQPTQHRHKNRDTAPKQ